VPKIIVSLSRKIPIPGLDYSSEGCLAGLETNLAEGATDEQVLEKMNHSYGLLVRAIDAQLASVRAPRQPASEQAAHPAEAVEATAPESRQPVPVAPPPDTSRQPSAGGHLASESQIRAIFAIGKSIGWSRKQLLAQLKERHGVEIVEALSRTDASAFITYLRRREGAAG
jgi:hypothetical protein